MLEAMAMVSDLVRVREMQGVRARALGQAGVGDEQLEEILARSS